MGKRQFLALGSEYRRVLGDGDYLSQCIFWLSGEGRSECSGGIALSERLCSGN